MFLIKKSQNSLSIQKKMTTFALAFKNKRYGGIAQLVRASDS